MAIRFGWLGGRVGIFRILVGGHDRRQGSQILYVSRVFKRSVIFGEREFTYVESADCTECTFGSTTFCMDRYIPLCNPYCYLLGPFTFEPRSDIVRPNQLVAREIQDSLLLLCTSLCIVPPILSLSSSKLSTKKIISPVALLGEI